MIFFKKKIGKRCNDLFYPKSNINLYLIRSNLSYMLQICMCMLMCRVCALCALLVFNVTSIAIVLLFFR